MIIVIVCVFSGNITNLSLQQCTEFFRHEKDTEQEPLLETDCDKTVSFDTDKEIDTDADIDTNNRHDKDSAIAGCASGNQVSVWSKPQDAWNSGDACPFTGGSSGLRVQETPHVNKDSTPIIVFLFFFMEVIQLLVAETNKYYSQY
jgi:hypothetical protein